MSSEPRKSYVYLAPHATEGRFKVGKSIHPEQRLSILEKNNSHAFKREAVFLVELETEKDALLLELILHKSLIKYKVSDDMCDIDGKTEWFLESGWEGAIATCKAVEPLISAKIVPAWNVLNEMSSKKEKILASDVLFESMIWLCERERLRQNLTQKELADMCKVSKRTIERFLSGRNVAMKTLFKVLDAIGFASAYQKVTNDYNMYLNKTVFKVRASGCNNKS